MTSTSGPNDPSSARFQQNRSPLSGAASAAAPPKVTMVRRVNNSRKAKWKGSVETTTKPLNKQERAAMLNLAAKMVLGARVRSCVKKSRGDKNNRGSLNSNKEVATYQSMNKILQYFHDQGHPWVTRGRVQYWLSVHKTNILNGIHNSSGDEKDITVEEAYALVEPLEVDDPRRSGLASTVASSAAEQEPAQEGEQSLQGDQQQSAATPEEVEALKEKIALGTTMAAISYSEKREEAKRSHKVCDRGTLKSIIQQVEVKLGLPRNALKRDSIRTRTDRRNLTGFSRSRQCPLSLIEPVVVDYCIRLARLGQPLDRFQVVELVQSMVMGTPLEAGINRWKMEHSRYTPGQDVVGVGWFRNFLKRHQKSVKLVRRKVVSTEDWEREQQQQDPTGDDAAEEDGET